MSRHINLSSFQGIQKTVAAAGTPVKLSGYYKAATIGFTNTAPATLTDSGSNFLKMGFRAGDKLVISGSASNDKTVEIATVVAATITLVTAAELVTEAASATVTLDTVQGIKVEDGVVVVIKAKSGNSGSVTVGPTSARALNTNTSYFSNYRLTAGQYINLQVRNLNEIWIDTTVNADGVEVLFEV